MRKILLMSAAVVVSIAAPAFAQEWTEFISRDDGFRVVFPGQPKVSETTYKTYQGADLPARVYRVERGQERYSMTVVDYRQVERILTEKAKACPPWADERCTGVPIVGLGYWKMDLGGAMTYAILGFLKRDAKLTDLSWNWQDLVEGYLLQLTSNADQSRTFAVIHLHEYRLYILEGTVAPGLPPPALFQQSLGFLDKEGKRIRYETTYSHGYPTPRRTR